jgi:hypothetical protein
LATPRRKSTTCASARLSEPPPFPPPFRQARAYPTEGGRDKLERIVPPASNSAGSAGSTGHRVYPK